MTTASVAGEVEALIRMNTGGVVFRRAVDLSAPGLVSIPYADFAGSPDFTDVALIGLLIRPGGAGTIAVTNFSAVPEPSTAALLGAGVLALAGWRRRPRGRSRCRA